MSPEYQRNDIGNFSLSGRKSFGCLAWKSIKSERKRERKAQTFRVRGVQRSRKPLYRT